MGEIDLEVIEVSKDRELKNYFIEKNELFIRKCASSCTRRFISKFDDEWSIALIAFSEAINDYSLEKGSFYGFAKLVIHRKLIDYIRKQDKHKNEILVDPSIFDSDSYKDENDGGMKESISKKMVFTVNHSLKYEIEAVNQVFSGYGFTFFDLAKCSPKAEKTKKACASAIDFILNDVKIINEMKQSKLLPILIIEKKKKIPRKLLERHRKYIIAAVEILSGEYPYLAEYMRTIREEPNI